jgi:parallel beta-helix repeat protein
MSAQVRVSGAILLAVLLSVVGAAPVAVPALDIAHEPARGVASAAPLVTTIYVSTAGNDATGDGSIGNPFRTVGHVLTFALPGDEIVLRGAPALADNRYTESIRIREPDITVRSQDGEWAIVECPVDDESIGACIYFDVDSSGGRLQRLEVIGGYYYGIMFGTRWDWGDPENRSGASNILVEDVKVHDTGNAAIKITPGCDDITVRRAELYNTGLILNPGSAEGIDNVNGDRMTVQDSYIHDTAGTGLYFKGGAIDCLVERTRIERTGGGGLYAGFDTSPEYFDLTVNPDYYESIRGVVRNNIISDTQYAGIGLFAAKDATIQNNTLVNTAQAGHAPLYFGLTYQDWEPEAGRPPSDNPMLRNNLIYQPGGLPAECVFIRYSDDLGGLSALNGMPEMDYDLYFRGGGDCAFTDRRPDSYLEHGTFAEWQGHIGGEAHSLTSDPRLTTDWHLLAGSPAINAGTTAGALAEDFDRQPRDVVPDIGADEYAAAATPAVQISVETGSAVLRWLPDPANSRGYEVLSSADPYFAPGDPGLESVVLPPGSSRYTDGTAQTRYFLVLGVNGAGETSAPSKPVGRFVFALVSG